MEYLRITLTVLFIIDCIALSVIILMQEGKSQGLGSLSGMSETYWGKNKGRFSKSNKNSWCIVLCVSFSIEFEILIMTLLHCKGVIFFEDKNIEKKSTN